MREITVGIDIGTTSVKAIAADADGTVVARSRVPHPIGVPRPDRFEHDARRAWRRGPRRALAALDKVDPLAVSVSAMVPSLTAVDRRGVPLTPGLLYGDSRGRTGSTADPTQNGEFLAFMRWTAQQQPDAFGYWPAQSVANYALAREAVLDTTTAVTTLPLFAWTGWDPDVARSLGVREQQLPRLVPTGSAAGRLGADGPILASGCVDAFVEQLVAGADNDGDVLVMCGTTLIVWVVVPETSPPEAPGYFTVPHTAPGKILVGGPSNVGGLFLNWARGLVAKGGSVTDPGRVPVWAPFPRGERVPLHDPDRRAVLADLDLTHDAAAIRRAAFEAAGFVTRRAIEAAGGHPRRIVATGGGVRVGDWISALADCTGLPVDCALVPEGAALGSAYLARMAAGLETDMADARRWARVGRRVEPDPRWTDAVKSRFGRFLELANEPERRS
jgi:xylulokinase